MSVASMKNKLDRLQKRAEKLHGVWSTSDPMEAHFSHGVGNMTARQARQRQAMNRQKGNAFAEWQKVQDEIKHLSQRIASVEAGEVHENGQPRVDAPSRVRKSNQADVYVQWMRSIVSPGSYVWPFTWGSPRPLCVVRVNKKTLTVQTFAGNQSDPYLDFWPMEVDGSEPTLESVQKRLYAYIKEREGMNESD